MNKTVIGPLHSPNNATVCILFQFPSTLYRQPLEEYSEEGTKHYVVTVFSASFIDGTRRERRSNVVWKGGCRMIHKYVPSHQG